MLKRINWRAVFIGFAWIVSLSGVVVLMSFINIKKQTVKCVNIKVLIPGADNFIEREEVDAILEQSEGVLLGRTLEQINTNRIEKRLRANPYIEYAKVFADMDGILHIEVKQRQPVLRVINASNQDFYIDNNGNKMPVSSNFTANVLVATGNIQEVFGGRVDTLRTQLAKDLYKTALYIKQDTLWDAQIEQVYVDDKNDIQLIPRVGNQHIVLGTADSLEVKMKNLLVFYKKAMPQVGWDTYKTISVKYSNQIVCEKAKVDSTAVVIKPKAISTVDSVKTERKVTDSLVNQAIAKELKQVKNKEKKTSVETPVLASNTNKTVKKDLKAVAKSAGSKSDTKKNKSN